MAYSERQLPTLNTTYRLGRWPTLYVAPVRFKLAGLKKAVAQMIGGVFALKGQVTR